MGQPACSVGRQEAGLGMRCNTLQHMEAPCACSIASARRVGTRPPALTSQAKRQAGRRARQRAVHPVLLAAHTLRKALRRAGGHTWT